jgi:hypothetical protein
MAYVVYPFLLIIIHIITWYSTATAPSKYGIVVFTGFQALGKLRDDSDLSPNTNATDVFGPLGTLNVLSRDCTMGLAIIAESLKPVSTNPEPNLFVSSSFGQEIVPTHTFANPPEVEVLIIPGGQCTETD